ITHFAWGQHPTTVTVLRTRKVDGYTNGDPCALGRPVLLPDSTSHIIDCDGVISEKPEVEQVTGTWLQLSRDVTTTFAQRTTFTSYAVGPTMLNSDPNNNEANWTALYD